MGEPVGVPRGQAGIGNFPPMLGGSVGDGDLKISPGNHCILNFAAHTLASEF